MNRPFTNSGLTVLLVSQASPLIFFAGRWKNKGLVKLAWSSCSAESTVLAGQILNLTSRVIMNNRACNVARADLQKIMALKRAILESAELLGYKQYK